MQLALGYTTFRHEQGASGPEAERVSAELQAACESRGLALKKVIGDVEPEPGEDAKRPGLSHAMELLAAREAGCLIVESLDRLFQSAAELGALLDRLDAYGVRLVVIDIDLDTSSEEGRLAARALVTVGALERRRAEPSAAVAPGTPPAAGAPAPPPGAPTRAEPAEAATAPREPAGADKPSVKRRIAEMRASGMTLQAIADALNREGVPTLRGGSEWRPSSVQAAAGYKRPHRKPKPDPGSGADKAHDG